MTWDAYSRRDFIKTAGIATTTAVLSRTALADADKKAAGGSKPFFELVGTFGMSNSLVELKDGSLLSNDGRTSKDGGRSWSDPRPFGSGVSGTGLMRLKSGKLALVSGVGYAAGRMWLSDDEGKNWGLAGPITTPAGPIFELGDTMIQLESGRLLYCWDYNMSGKHSDLEYIADSAYGTIKGKRYHVEGHGHIPEFFCSGFSWSDDEGKSWMTDKDAQNMPNAVMMGWFDEKGEPNGASGITPCGEASIAQAKDGRVLLLGRSTVGRLVQTFSNDNGRTWTALRPSALASSNSPPRLRRIPKTGDLLCVWNQVTGEEIRKGFRRSRLSSAISKDSGATWENFKTIEVCNGLADVTRVTPESEIKPVRARKDVGALPDGYAFFHYSNVCFAGDNVYLMYSRGYPDMGVAEQLLERQDQVLRIYPLEWFYT